MRRVVPSDLYPLVLGFLRDNQLPEVANKFAKATGAVSAGFGQGLGWDDYRASGPDRFRFPGTEVSRVRRSGIFRAFVRAFGEPAVSAPGPHEVPVDSVESCCFFPLERCSDGSVGSSCPRSRGWRSAARRERGVPSEALEAPVDFLGFKLANAKHDLTITLRFTGNSKIKFL